MLPLTKLKEGQATLFVLRQSFRDPFHCKVFFNPHMRFNRSISSLALSVSLSLLQTKKAVVVDGLCALGARGIRYAKENKGIETVFFVDANQDAIPLLKKNIKENSLQKRAVVACNDLNRFLANSKDYYDFIEIDPFGSPVFFLENALRRLKKKAVLSVTATDLANLSGAHMVPCMKNYDAKPLANYFQHETALRILIGRVARTGLVFDVACTPLFSFYHRHYVKAFFLCEKSAMKADEMLQHMGFLLHCPSCFHRFVDRRQKESCPECGHALEYAGPLWTSPLNDSSFLQNMVKANNKRKGEGGKDIAKLLGLLQEENALPAAFFDVHALSKKLKVSVKGMEEIMRKLEKKGFRVSRTHFAPTALKTDAPAREVVAALK